MLRRRPKGIRSVASSQDRNVARRGHAGQVVMSQPIKTIVLMQSSGRYDIHRNIFSCPRGDCQGFGLQFDARSPLEASLSAHQSAPWFAGVCNGCTASAVSPCGNPQTERSCPTGPCSLAVPRSSPDAKGRDRPRRGADLARDFVQAVVRCARRTMEYAAGIVPGGVGLTGPALLSFWRPGGRPGCGTQ
jgi:hypothetical protein